MKIVLLADTYIPDINGVAVSVYTHYKVLKEHGHEVTVVYPNNHWHLKIEQDFVKLPGFPLKRLYGYRASPFYSARALKYIKKLNPDIIHVHTEAGVGLFGRKIARKLNLPLVYTYHTMYEDYGYYVTKGMLEYPTRMAIRGLTKIMTGKRVTQFITPSVKTRDYFKHIVGLNTDINIVPTGIDLERFYHQSDPNTLAVLRQKLKLQPDEKIIISLGRIAKEKSIDICLKGYKEFLDNYPLTKSKFLIVGDGPAKEELEGLTVKLGISDKVLFIGKVPVEEVPYYYHLADIFVNASVSETQGLTYVEAMASGLILLVKFDENIVGLINNGKNGLFFSDEHDFSLFINRIINFSKEQKERIILESVKSTKIYSLTEFYQKLIIVYDKAIRKYW